MIICSIILKSQLEGAHRIDAEYYQPEYLVFGKKLKAIGEVSLGKLAFITDGQHGYHIVDPLSSIRHLTAKSVSHWLVNDDGADRLAEETNRKNLRSALEFGDILISTAGTIGSVGIVSDDVLPANIDQDVARVHIHDQSLIDPFFLIAFLNSKFGQFQIERETTGQIQTHIALEKIKNRLFISIPKWQGLIADLVKQGLRSCNDSKNLYSQAVVLLLSELGLTDFEEHAGLFGIVRFSEVRAAERIDADYFDPKFRKLFSAIQRHQPAKLGDLVTMKKGVEPGSEAYEEGDKLFIRVSNLSKEGLTDNSQKYLSEKLYQELRKDYEPKEGEILLSKDATPGIAYVLKESVKGINSGGIMRLKIKNEEVDPEYLALCINSIIGQMQAKRDAGGSIIQHWKPEQIKNVLVPLLPLPVQQQISALVRQSHEARRKSKALLEDAKRKVEEEIEKQTI
ncbi:restriction endonuclease subunit S [Candidatus Peregrinibacteria bacterium]|nr:restriction endonuclease subunit S [Candidatus Peregrinibacteria bacterium]